MNSIRYLAGNEAAASDHEPESGSAIASDSLLIGTKAAAYRTVYNTGASNGNLAGNGFTNETKTSTTDSNRAPFISSTTGPAAGPTTGSVTGSAAGIGAPNISISTNRIHGRQSSLLWRLLIILCQLFHITSSTTTAAAAALGKQSSSVGRRSGPRAKKRRTSSNSSALPPIPRLFAKRQRKLLVLDLDETLVHSMARAHHRTSQLVEVHLRNTAMPSFYYVEKRPYCTDFLTAVMQWYDVAIFTASVSEYADPIIDLLERDVGRRCFKRRLYRDSCVSDGNGGYIKDLRVFGCDLSRVLLVDNSPVSFARQRLNGLAVEGWISDPSDRTLLQLLPLLFALRHTSDVRSILSLHDSSLIPAAESKPTALKQSTAALRNHELLAH